MDMEPMDLIQDKFSQDCTIETVLHLLMAHFDMTEEQAQAEIDEYFEIMDWMDKHRETLEEDLGYAKKSWEVAPKFRRNLSCRYRGAACASL